MVDMNLTHHYLTVPEFQSSNEVTTYLDVFKCNLYKAFSSCAICKDNELRFTWA